mgnify:CR=1 FL=1|nr:MAG TPA: antitoxin [Caudoviricetes sp.]
MLKPESDKTVLHLVLDKSLLAALDEMARALHLSRSACARMLLSQQLCTGSKAQETEAP